MVAQSNIIERPVMFSSAMVEAILAGKKTQTRRVLTRGSCTVDGSRWTEEMWGCLDFDDVFTDPGGTDLFGDGPYLKVSRPTDHFGCQTETRHRVRWKWEVGDQLWIKEPWRVRGDWDDQKPSDISDGAHVAYGALKGRVWGKTRNSMFMPRWASRVQLRITEKRFQRIQSISEKDAKAEGVSRRKVYEQGAGGNAFGRLRHYPKFREVWDLINYDRGYPWESNPWVAAITFEVVKPKRKLKNHSR